MPHENECCATCQHRPLTAERIINDIALVKDLDEMREDLKTMWEQYVLLNEDSTADERAELYVTYMTLWDALCDIETLKDREG